MSRLSPAHIALLRLLAKQAIKDHLTSKTNEIQGESAMRQNHPSLQNVATR